MQNQEITTATLHKVCLNGGRYSPLSQGKQNKRPSWGTPHKVIHSYQAQPKSQLQSLETTILQYTICMPNTSNANCEPGRPLQIPITWYADLGGQYNHPFLGMENCKTTWTSHYKVCKTVRPIFASHLQNMQDGYISYRFSLQGMQTDQLSLLITRYAKRIDQLSLPTYKVCKTVISAIASHYKVCKLTNYRFSLQGMQTVRSTIASYYKV